MNLDPSRFQGLSDRELLLELIEHVTATEEEQERNEQRSGSSTDLNIYILDNEGYEIGSLTEYVDEIIRSPKSNTYAKQYVRKHTFSEELIGPNVSLVEITTPEKSRSDSSIWLAKDGYLWVLTTEREDWRKTIENLIKYLPQVDRIFLSSEYLEQLATGVEDGSISGFTAKYNAEYADREATLRFHGGTDEDLAKAEKEFNAKPTRIEFDQTNSPEAAITGAGTNEGRLSIQSVLPGSQDKAVDTVFDVSTGYQELDREGFEIEHSPVHERLENGITVEGFTAIELTEPDREPDSTEASLMEELKDNVLNGRQYRWGQRDDQTLRVFDSVHEEFFDIALEPPDIVIYPRESTTALSLRDVVQEIFEYDSTYSHEKLENPVAGR
jgi:hypothetical protein